MSIACKTKSGTEVTLTGMEYCERPIVRVEFTYPGKGRVHFDSANYGEVKGNHGIIGYIGGQHCCVTVLRADFDAAMAEARAIGEREIAALKSGAALITPHWHEGEYLSGWSIGGRAAELLIELGLVSEVSGWGHLVPTEVVNALGTTFSYAAAAEHARPALEAAVAKKSAKLEARTAKFTLAHETGQAVELRRWSEECCERDFECDLDIVTEYAMPDGTTKTSRCHTH